MSGYQLRTKIIGVALTFLVSIFTGTVVAAATPALGNMHEYTTGSPSLPSSATTVDIAAEKKSDQLSNWEIWGKPIVMVLAILCYIAGFTYLFTRKAAKK